MILSLDANVLIDLIRGKPSAVQMRWDEAQQAGLLMKLSSIALHEVMFGVHLSARPDRQAALLERFVSAVEIESWTQDDAVVAAEVSARLERRGERIGAYDILIAGQALARGWTVVTANVGEFARVSGLPIVNWRDQPGIG